MEPQVVTEDGATLQQGDRAYNYYDMKPGMIEDLNPADRGWFKFLHDDGTTAFLNGQRICSLTFAARRGFKGVEG